MNEAPPSPSTPSSLHCAFGAALVLALCAGPLARADSYGPGKHPPRRAGPLEPGLPPPGSAPARPKPEARPEPEPRQSQPPSRDSARALLKAVQDACLPPAETSRITLTRGRRRGLFTRARKLDVAVRRGLDGSASLRIRTLDPPDLRGSALLYERTASGSVKAWTYDPSERRVRRTTEPSKCRPLAGTGLQPEDLLGGLLAQCRAPARFEATMAGEKMVAGRRCRVLEVKLFSADGALVKQGSIAVALGEPVPVRVEEWDTAGKPQRISEPGRWTRIAGWWRPLELSIRGRGTGSSEAVVRVVEAVPQTALDDETFSPRRLGRYP